MLCTHVVVVFSSLFFFLLSYILRGQTAFHTLNGISFIILYWYKYCVIIGPFVPFGLKKNQQINTYIFCWFIWTISYSYIFFCFLIYCTADEVINFSEILSFPLSLHFVWALVNLFGHAPLTFYLVMLALLFGHNLMPSAGAYSVNTFIICISYSSFR